MTDRVQHLTIVLDNDYRTDDVQDIINAIRMVKGVAHVTPGKPVGMEDYLARLKVHTDIRQKLLNFLNELAKG